jgi:hypothetical protein
MFIIYKHRLPPALPPPDQKRQWWAKSRVMEQQCKSFGQGVCFLCQLMAAALNSNLQS